MLEKNVCRSGARGRLPRDLVKRWEIEGCRWSPQNGTQSYVIFQRTTTGPGSFTYNEESADIRRTFRWKLQLLFGFRRRLMRPNNEASQPHTHTRARTRLLPSTDKIATDVGPSGARNDMRCANFTAYHYGTSWMRPPSCYFGLRRTRRQKIKHEKLGCRRETARCSSSCVIPYGKWRPVAQMDSHEEYTRSALTFFFFFNMYL